MDDPRFQLVKGRKFVFQVMIFLAVFSVSQWGWTLAAGSDLEHLTIDTLTVKPAVALINLLTPTVNAVGEGPRIWAPGGGINILNGCEGTEVIFLLLAALLASGLPWRAKLTGALVGIPLILGLNQGRILALFYASRSDKALFDLLHGMVAPIALVVAVTVFFIVWSNYWLAHAGPYADTNPKN